MDVFSAGASGLFADPVGRSAQVERQSKTALANGLELYGSGKYDEAIRELKRAVGLAPVSQQAVDAYNYIAQSYVRKDDNQSAIATYRLSLRLSANNPDTYAALGKVYYSDGNYSEAVRAYEQAVRLDGNAANRYALGQAYLADGRLDEAESEFDRVRRLEPDKPSGEYGVGQVYAREGRYAEAVSAFDRALALEGSFLFALADKGYALMDSGDADEAQAVVRQLEDRGSNLSAALDAYIIEKSPAEMISVGAGSTFSSLRGPGTTLSELGVSGANAAGTFSMIFRFSKEMDLSSVTNPLNWIISRSTGSGRGDGYNFDLPIPDTEAQLPAFPTTVTYDADELSATVWFRLSQNAAGNATIDPSHVRFAFHGRDVFGGPMSAEADAYTGLTGFV